MLSIEEETAFLVFITNPLFFNQQVLSCFNPKKDQYEKNFLLGGGFIGFSIRGFFTIPHNYGKSN
jgi:hypothetical protein